MPNLEPFYAIIKEVENKGKFSKVRLDTYRKDSREKDEKKQRKYSNWFNTVFVGEANDMLVGMKMGDMISVTNAMITNERWEDKDGKSRWPGHSITVFKWEMPKGKGGNPQSAPSNVPDEPDEDEIPF